MRPAVRGDADRRGSSARHLRQSSAPAPRAREHALAHRAVMCARRRSSQRSRLRARRRRAPPRRSPARRPLGWPRGATPCSRPGARCAAQRRRRARPRRQTSRQACAAASGRASRAAVNAASVMSQTGNKREERTRKKTLRVAPHEIWRRGTSNARANSVRRSPQLVYVAANGDCKERRVL